MVVDASDFPALNKISAIGYRDLMGIKIKRHHRKKKKKKAAPEEEFSSDSAESCSLSPPRTTAAALKEWNGVRELAGKKGLTASGFLCCLVAPRGIQLTCLYSHHMCHNIFSTETE